MQNGENTAANAADATNAFDSLDPSGQVDGGGFEVNTLEVTPLPKFDSQSSVAAVPVNNRKKPRGKYKTFEERVADLRTYKAKHGHTNVKHTEDKGLAQFCSATRHARKNLNKFKQGKGRAKLDEERIAALDAIGFDWKAGSSSSSSSSNGETLTPTNLLPLVNRNVVTNYSTLAQPTQHFVGDHSMSFGEEDLVYL